MCEVCWMGGSGAATFPVVSKSWRLLGVAALCGIAPARRVGGSRRRVRGSARQQAITVPPRQPDLSTGSWDLSTAARDGVPPELQ